MVASCGNGHNRGTRDGLDAWVHRPARRARAGAAGLFRARRPARAEGTALEGGIPEHEAHVVEFSPNSRVLVTDGASGGCIRDVATGRVLVPLMRAGADGPSRAVHITWPRFTADGQHVIVQLGGPRFGPERTVTLAVFDVATGRERASFAGVGSGIWHGSALPPAEYALSADGSTLAFCRVTCFGPDRSGQVTVWDIHSEKVVADVPGLPPLALSPDGDALAHGDNDDARSRTAFPTIRTRFRAARPDTPRCSRGVRMAGRGAGRLLARRQAPGGQGPGSAVGVRCRSARRGRRPGPRRAEPE